MNVTLNISDELFARIENQSHLFGFTKPEDYILDVLEKKLDSTASEEEKIEKKLKELGYM
jgi:hypothetical protein